MTVNAMTTTWPYPVVLTHSIKAYPVVPVMREVGPQDPTCWPPPLAPEVMQWRNNIGGNVFNQLYIHVPFCPFLCHFCPLYKVETPRQRGDHAKARYVAALLREIDRWAQTSAVRDTQFHSVYIGGGTPTELTPAQLGSVLDHLRSRMNIATDAEVTLEGVARQMLADDYLSAMVQHGVNRISFGIQSLDPAVRKHIGRGDAVQDYAAIFSTVRKRWPALSINTEIMAGLPGQTLASLDADLDQLLAWAPNSLDILYYVLMPGTKLQRLVTLGRRSQPRHGEELLAARSRINERMRSSGYQQLTAEVFVREDRDLFTRASFGGARHRLNTVLALGPSGFGLVGGVAYQNRPDLDAYHAADDANLLPIARVQPITLPIARRRAQLFSVLELAPDLAAFDQRRDRRLLARWQRQGLVERYGDHMRLTTRGALWYNHLQMDLLPLSDLVRTLGMFGSLAEQRASLGSGIDELPPHHRELVDVIRGRGMIGRLRFAAYRAYLRYAAWRGRDRAALGFTGPVAE